MAASNTHERIYIPPELLVAMFRYNCKEDLQNIRLACREFNEVAISLLYHELTRRLDVTEQEIARRPSFTFGRYVRVLKFLAICYDNIPSKKYAKSIRKRCKQQKVAYDERLGKQSLDGYHTLVETHRSAMNTGLIEAYAMSLLDHMPNVEIVLISDGICRSPSSGLSDGHFTNQASLSADHKPYNVALGSGHDGIIGPEYWHLLARIISTSSMHITKLSVYSSFPGGHGLKPKTLSTTGPSLDQTLNIFANLTTLELEVDGERSSSASKSALAYVLARATKLEVLELRTVSDIGDYLGVVLRGCAYPKLRICILNCFISTSEQLLRFLSFPERLTHLNIGHHCLEGRYTWQQLVPVLKTQLPFLQEMRMTTLGDLWVNSLIQDYFFRGGPNPFKGNKMDSDLKKSALKKTIESVEKTGKESINGFYDGNDEDSEDESEDDWTGMSQYMDYEDDESCVCRKCD
ncbi:MAG: hypothetical protein Q9169_005633 [Polycauliona sp. 2 TL-2023]